MSNCPDETLMAYYKEASADPLFQKKYPPIVHKLLMEFGEALCNCSYGAVAKGDAAVIAADTTPAMTKFLLDVANDPDYPTQLRKLHQTLIKKHRGKLTDAQVKIIESGNAITVANAVREEQRACNPIGPAEMSTMTTLWVYFPHTTT